MHDKLHGGVFLVNDPNKIGSGRIPNRVKRSRSKEYLNAQSFGIIQRSRRESSRDDYDPCLLVTLKGANMKGHKVREFPGDGFIIRPLDRSRYSSSSSLSSSSVSISPQRTSAPTTRLTGPPMELWPSKTTKKQRPKEQSRIKPMVLQERQWAVPPRAQSNDPDAGFRLRRTESHPEFNHPFNDDANRNKVIPDDLRVPGRLEGQSVVTSLNTACKYTLVRRDTAERCGLSQQIDQAVNILVDGAYAVGHIHSCYLSLGDVTIEISPIVVENLPFDIIIGLDTLWIHKFCVDFSACELVIGPYGRAGFETKSKERPSLKKSKEKRPPKNEPPRSMIRSSSFSNAQRKEIRKMITTELPRKYAVPLVLARNNY